MTTTAIYASRILTPHEEISEGVIIVEGSQIQAVGHRDEIRIPAGAIDFVATGLTVVPGFVDIHIHGAGGHDVMEAEHRALHRIATTVARHGTTSMLATTVTAPTEEMCRSLEGIASYIRARETENQKEESDIQSGSQNDDRSREDIAVAEILGMHLEGPFISPLQRGVHPPDAIAEPSIQVLEKFLQAADGLVKIVTLAPELSGALEMIEFAVAAGLAVGMGHTNADYDQARAAIRAGSRHAVHTFNAMRPFTHRDPGILGAIMTDPEVTAEIIADGVHVAVPAIQVLIGCKGSDSVILVTDGIAATGMPDGTYRLGNFEVNVRGGVARNPEGKLAGSTLTLDRAIRNVVAYGVPLIEAIRMATILPARRLGLAGKKGVIAPGADADIVALTPDLRIAGIMTRGVGLMQQAR